MSNEKIVPDFTKDAKEEERRSLQESLIKDIIPQCDSDTLRNFYKLACEKKRMSAESSHEQEHGLSNSAAHHDHHHGSTRSSRAGKKSVGGISSVYRESVGSSLEKNTSLYYAAREQGKGTVLYDAHTTNFRQQGVSLYSPRSTTASKSIYIAPAARSQSAYSRNTTASKSIYIAPAARSESAYYSRGVSVRYSQAGAPVCPIVIPETPRSSLVPLVATSTKTNYKEALKERKLQVAFDFFDKDGSNTIGKDELLATLDEVGVIITEEEKMAIHNELPDEIYFDEFKEIIANRRASKLQLVGKITQAVSHIFEAMRRNVKLAKMMGMEMNCLASLDTKLTTLYHMQNHYRMISKAKPSVDSWHYSNQSRCYHAYAATTSKLTPPPPGDPAQNRMLPIERMNYILSRTLEPLKSSRSASLNAHGTGNHSAPATMSYFSDEGFHDESPSEEYADENENFSKADTGVGYNTLVNSSYHGNETKAADWEQNAAALEPANSAEDTELPWPIPAITLNASSAISRGEGEKDVQLPIMSVNDVATPESGKNGADGQNERNRIPTMRLSKKKPITPKKGLRFDSSTTTHRLSSTGPEDDFIPTAPISEVKKRQTRFLQSQYNKIGL